MKHGKRHRAEVAYSLPEWEPQFMSYKALKRQVKLFHPRSSSGKKRSGINAVNGGRNHMDSVTDFTRLLDHELDKVNRFYVDKEEDYIIRLKELQLKVANLEINEEKLKVQKDILDFHAEMVMLLHYSVLNFTGLIKIVKKHNKRVGATIRLPSTSRVLQQPFFSTELLYNLMRECEALLVRLSVTN